MPAISLGHALLRTVFMGVYIDIEYVYLGKGINFFSLHLWVNSRILIKRLAVLGIR